METKEARKGVRGQSAKASPRCDVCAGREQAVFGKDVPGRRARESKALGETPAWHARGTASGRGWQGQGKSSQQPTVRVLCSSLTEEEIEAQGGEVTCPESHSQGAEQSQAVWERGVGRCSKTAWPGGDSQRAHVTCLGHSHGCCDCAESPAGSLSLTLTPPLRPFRI